MTLDAARLEILQSLAVSAVAAECFPSLRIPADAVDRSAETQIAQRRAICALVAADELGMSIVDALNRARFGEDGLSFAPAVAGTFDDALREEIAQKERERQRAIERQRRAKPDDAETETLAASQQKLNENALIPADYVPPGKRLGDCNAGELAYFIEESAKKNAVAGVRGAAWEVLGRRIPVADALELGKMTRWIVAPSHPERRKVFADVLVVAERRMEEITAGVTQGGAS
jgi:hypothetical protein